MPLSATPPAGEPEFTESLRAARRALAAERRVLRTEVDAFAAFCRRVRALDCEPARAGAGAPSAAAGALATRREHDSGSPNAPIREAYAETVMATPHYDEEYGDTYWRSVASEFGGELATALRQSAGVTPLLRDQVLAAGREAERSRERMLDTLADEEAALDEAEAVLAAVREEVVAIESRPFYDCPERELQRLLTDLDSLDGDCQRLAVRRQAGDLEPETFRLPSRDTRPLTDYLYQSIPSTYPVLRAVGRASGRVATTAQRIRRLLPEAAAN